MNYTKKILFTLIVFFLGAPLFAQETGSTEITGDKKTALVTSIEKAHKQLSSLSANFTQEKTSTLFTEKIVQKGKLNYKAPKQLRWEYTSPKAMTVIFSNGKVLLKTEKGTSSNPNKMLGEMGNMIINTINGSFLKENPDFSTRYYKNKSGHYVVVLTPINKKIRAYYKNISITLNSSTFLADKVVLTEVNGDATTITFADKKTNTTLSDSLFK
jgi:outer membrane lipoprotein-sorting protein